jgi:hypothetical protein
MSVEQGGEQGSQRRSDRAAGRVGGSATERTRVQDRRRVRWPLLATAGLLGLLLALTSALDRSAPSLPSSAPAVADLPQPLLDEPVRCTRSDERASIDDVRRVLRSEGRITSAIVSACPRLLAGRDVVYVGEVVGDVLRRDGGAWVQVNDDAYALEVGPFGAHRGTLGFSSGLTVWLPDGLHEGLGAPGRHGRRGDVVRIEGRLLRADPADGGGITVRARSLEVLAPSTVVEEPLNVPLVVAAVAAVLLACLSWGWARLRARRRAL